MWGMGKGRRVNGSSQGCWQLAGLLSKIMGAPAADTHLDVLHPPRLLCMHLFFNHHPAHSPPDHLL
jgi:hypothetical protein